MCARISIDSSGELLHRRGYRREAGAAPLRETLAAGVLLKLGWDGGVPLVDPMCGSGSFLIEGALLAGGIPPGMQRDFAFMHWPKFRPGAWQALREQYRPRRELPPLSGCDRDGGVLARAMRNAARAGVAESIAWHHGEAGTLVAPPAKGLIVCNPPYGARLGHDNDLPRLYRDFGSVLRTRFAGWRFAFLCPEPLLAQAAGLGGEVVGRFSNGGIRVTLQAGEVASRQGA